MDPLVGKEVAKHQGTRVIADIEDFKDMLMNHDGLQAEVLELG